jgi:hypothetical protein
MFLLLFTLLALLAVILFLFFNTGSILIAPAKLEEIGAELSKIESELRKGLGLRTSRKKSDTWKVSNTMDLIAVVLETWGRCGVESIEKKFKKNGKTIREYSLHINKDNKIWEYIYGSNINMDSFSIVV